MSDPFIDDCEEYSINFMNEAINKEERAFCYFQRISEWVPY